MFNWGTSHEQSMVRRYLTEYGNYEKQDTDKNNHGIKRGKTNSHDDL